MLSREPPQVYGPSVLESGLWQSDVARRLRQILIDQSEVETHSLLAEMT